MPQFHTILQAIVLKVRLFQVMDNWSEQIDEELKITNQKKRNETIKQISEHVQFQWSTNNVDDDY